MKTFSKKFWFKLLSFIAVFLFLFFIFNKKPSVTSEDRLFIAAFLKDWNITETPRQVHQSFESEIEFLSKVQDSIVGNILHKEVDHNMFGNIKFYYNGRKGFCYDRSVMMEKIFSEYGFNFRHVFVYYNLDSKKNTTMADFYKSGTASHALTEIETKKGWMAMGSNCNWIGITKNNELLTTNTLNYYVKNNKPIDFKKDPCFGKEFWHAYPHFRFVYGIYSRKGNFFSPHIPVPEANMRMLLYNL
ncbi:MAG: hypothetical protein ACJ748_16225 [Flavisolibacter sp.]